MVMVEHRSRGPVDVRSDILDRVGAILSDQVDSATLISAESNWIYRLDCVSGRSYCLRVPRLTGDLTAFWDQLLRTFGVLYRKPRGTGVAAVVDFLRSLDILDVPRFVGMLRVGEVNGYLSSWMIGDRVMDGTFPSSHSVQFEIGRFLGRAHQVEFDHIGALDTRVADPTEFVTRANRGMLDTIMKYWRDQAYILQLFAEYASNFDGRLLWPPCLIMPDISASQFVYGANRPCIVDIDSYVVGPRELELAAIETCLTEPAAFRAGYEQFSVLPRFRDFRSYFRLWLMVCDVPERLTPDVFGSRNWFD